MPPPRRGLLDLSFSIHLLCFVFHHSIDHSQYLFSKGHLQQNVNSMKIGLCFAHLHLFRAGIKASFLINICRRNEWIWRSALWGNTFLCLRFCFLVLICFGRWRFWPNWIPQPCLLTNMELNICPSFQTVPDTFIDSQNIIISVSQFWSWQSKSLLAGLVPSKDFLSASPSLSLFSICISSLSILVDDILILYLLSA